MRLLVHVEGQTEEEFVNAVIGPHLGSRGYDSVSARLLGSRRERSSRGGIKSWMSVKREVVRHLKQDQHTRSGLVVDFYGLPNDWPGRTAAASAAVPKKSDIVVQALRADLEELGPRFFPCILVHEFEAMVFVDPSAAARAWGRADLESQLRSELDGFSSVEEINDSPMSAPSKRLLRIDPRYQKPLQGLLVVHEVGLPTLRGAMTSLANWLGMLEAP